MERWRRRFLRVALPFGILWFLFGVVSLVSALSVKDARPGAVVQALVGVTGGIILVAMWWADRRERASRPRDSGG